MRSCDVLQNSANHGPITNILIGSRLAKLSDICVGLDAVVCVELLIFLRN